MRLPPLAVRKPTAAAAASGQVALGALGGAELEAGRQVDEQPGLELAVGDRLPDVRCAESGGDVPVDAADVVAGLVEAGLARLAAVAGHEAAVVAVQQPVEAAGDRQLEAPQDLDRRRRPAARRHRPARRRLGTRAAASAAGRSARPQAGRRRPPWPRWPWPATGASAMRCGAPACSAVGAMDGAMRGAGTVPRMRARRWSAERSRASAS